MIGKGRKFGEGRQMVKEETEGSSRRFHHWQPDRIAFLYCTCSVRFSRKLYVKYSNGINIYYGSSPVCMAVHRGWHKAATIERLIEFGGVEVLQLECTHIG